jgi:hypothetical protein
MPVRHTKMISGSNHTLGRHAPTVPTCRSLTRGPRALGAVAAGWHQGGERAKSRLWAGGGGCSDHGITAVLFGHGSELGRLPMASLSDFHQEIAREHQADLQREAAQERLARTARLGRAPAPLLLRRHDLDAEPDASGWLLTEGECRSPPRGPGARPSRQRGSRVAHPSPTSRRLETGSLRM